ncbi:response regulator transcription factor [Deinococcus pimensis]|uniref:response regulator transcription factor n=1 Tax=Deinococcus pimensis TaxID=309888 RepID=UPI0024817FEA|nr:response regulator transcription factor [Deinococcus pimensis]
MLLVDDHEVVRAGLRGLLTADGTFEVVGEAGDGREAIDLVETLEPDVVLMDLRMPNMDGAAATAAIKKRFPRTQVMVLTTYDTDGDILKAVEAGAAGYLLKDTPRLELLKAVHMAARGQTPLAPSVAARLMEQMRRPKLEPLTAREMDVLRLASEGLANKEIGKHLFISEATVKSHLINIYSKLGVDSRTAAARRATELGLI